MKKTYITYLHKRNNLAELSQKERNSLLLKMIEDGIDLTEEEEKMLSDKDMKLYVGKKLQRAGGLTPYELKFTDDIEKSIYVMTDKRLELLFPIINSLDEKWRQAVLTQAVFQNKGVTDDLFNSLSDKDKKFYVNLSIANSAYFSPTQLKYLTPKNQKLIISQIIERGEDFSADQLKSLTAENQLFYKKLNIKRSNIQESIRLLIKKMLKEMVSEPGTIFGPFHDEIILKKDKLKPQYYTIALGKASKICSNAKISNQEIDCPIDYEIEKTNHSTERQFRHISSTIEDENIKNIIDRSIDRLVRLLLSNAIKIGDKVHLKDKKSDLNVIIGIDLEKESSKESIIKIKIITVMNKSNFITGIDTKGPITI